MKTIKLTKVELSEIEALQNIVTETLVIKNRKLKSSDNYFGDIILIEILQGLFYNFRGKIENKKGIYCSFSVSPAQAVSILFACTERKNNSNDFENFVAMNYKNIFHEHLINL